MKTILGKKIQGTIADLCLKANLSLRGDVLRVLQRAYRREHAQRAKHILAAIIENARIARTRRLAICQDTGLPIVFVALGQGVRIAGDLNREIQKGIVRGYQRGFFRNSVIQDPLARGPSGWGPAIIHVDVVTGNKLTLTVLPKGFGCENKSTVQMFKPTAGIREVRAFIVESVRAAGPDACPPYVIGVGIGGTCDYAALLAKKALLRDIRRHHRKPAVRSLENKLLEEINSLNIGPMGLGGKTTALAVAIETYPTHIAGLPVAVNISCHALRSASATL